MDTNSTSDAGVEHAPAQTDSEIASPAGLGFAAALGYLLLFWLVVLACAGVLNLIAPGSPGLARVLDDDTCLRIGYVMGAAFILWRGIRTSEGRWRSWFPFRRVGVRQLALAIVGVFAITLAIVALARLLPFYEDIKTKQDPPDTSVILLLLVCILGPVSEELLFRGWMFSGFLVRYSPTKAIVFSALLFAVSHVHPMAIIQTFAIGCFFAWLVRKTGSLLPAMAAHAAINTVVTMARLFG
ncbi:MAG TPA: type II CAAX endopeptidase family protein [Candidatus Krumholzibacteria bacterium]